jgi:hypothetical protein
VDNPISINLNNENNSMDSLSFTWKAIFLDGSVIEQFENGVERRFQEVKDKFDKLTLFSLVNKDYSQCFTVDVRYGLIFFNNYLFIDKKEIKENVRLINFRRRRTEITMDNIIKSHTIKYHLGFQYLKDGKNQKIILIIDEHGNWSLGE